MAEKNSIKLFEEKFPIIGNTEALKEVMSENLDGIEVNGFSLPKIKIPAGGGTSFEEPVDGKSFEAIILVHQNLRAYWENEYEGDGTPPDCSSMDTVTGVGTPGGLCGKCPMAQFGTDKNERGQACKKVIKLFVMRENRALPEVLTLPPTSLKAYRDYVLELASLGVMKYGIMTKFSLEKEKNASGIAYSKIKMEAGEKLPFELWNKIKAYSNSVRANFIDNAPVVETDDFYLDEDEK